MPSYNFLNAVFQRGCIQRTFNPYSSGHVIRIISRHHLAQKPESLLCERKWQFSFPRNSLDDIRSLAGNSDRDRSFNDVSHLRDRGCLEKATQGKINLKNVT